jgi:hypothetical protein
MSSPACASRSRWSVKILGALLVCCSAHVGLRRCHAEIPVEGDRELLKRIRDCVAAAREQYPSGRMKVKARLDGGLEGELTGEYVWRLESQYWNVQSWLGSPGDARNKPTPTQLIATPKLRIEYSPAIHAATQDLGGRRSHEPPLFVLRPADAWYCYECSTQSPFDRLLDVNAATGYSRFLIRKTNEGLIEIRCLRRDESDLVITSDPGRGYNITGYATEGTYNAEFGDHPSRGRFQWAADGDGGWYCRERVIEAFPNPEAKTPTFRLTCAIEEFDPRAKIAADRFTFRSLDLPSGILVTETGGKLGMRKWRVRNPKDGGEAESPSDIRLKELSEKLKEGFAKPGREKR